MLKGHKNLGFVLMEAPPGMTERFFVAVEPLERKAGSGYGPRNS
jgi:hypothetical protein